MDVCINNVCVWGKTCVIFTMLKFNFEKGASFVVAVDCFVWCFLYVLERKLVGRSQGCDSHD